MNQFHMLIVEHCLAKEYDWLIKRFEVFRSTKCSVVEKFMPRTDISIIFHFKRLPAIMETSCVLLDPFFIAPIISESLLLRMEGHCDTFVIICNPTVLSRILNINLTPQYKYSIDLPHNLFFPLWKEMASLCTMEERIACFNRFIAGLYPDRYVKDSIDVLYDVIMEQGMNHSLKEIMQTCCASPRTLERQFLRRTGVSPKTFVRIRRLNYLFNKEKNDYPVDYLDMAFNGHYFDQSHFINDFKSIMGETPGNFFKHNLDNTNIMSGNMEGCL